MPGGCSLSAGFSTLQILYFILRMIRYSSAKRLDIPESDGIYAPFMIERKRQNVVK